MQVDGATKAEELIHLTQQARPGCRCRHRPRGQRHHHRRVHGQAVRAVRVARTHAGERHASHCLRSFVISPPATRGPCVSSSAAATRLVGP